MRTEVTGVIPCVRKREVSNPKSVVVVAERADRL